MNIERKNMEPVKPETIKTIQNDPFAMLALQATREFLMMAHRDWSRLTRDGKMIFEHDEAGIAWDALGELIGAEIKESDLPSDTTVNVGGVCMNIKTIDMLQRALRDGFEKTELSKHDRVGSH